MGNICDRIDGYYYRRFNRRLDELFPIVTNNCRTIVNLFPPSDTLITYRKISIYDRYIGRTIDDLFPSRAVQKLQSSMLDNIDTICETNDIIYRISADTEARKNIIDDDINEFVKHGKRLAEIVTCVDNDRINNCTTYTELMNIDTSCRQIYKKYQKIVPPVQNPCKWTRIGFTN